MSENPPWYNRLQFTGVAELDGIIWAIILSPGIGIGMWLCGYPTPPPPPPPIEQIREERKEKANEAGKVFHEFLRGAAGSDRSKPATPPQ